MINSDKISGKYKVIWVNNRQLLNVFLRGQKNETQHYTNNTQEDDVDMNSTTIKKKQEKNERIEKEVKKNVSQKQKPIIAICAATHSTLKWKTLADSTLQTLMIPSIEKTVSVIDRNKYNFHLYLAADHDDNFWLKNKDKIQVPKWLSLHFHFFKGPLHKIPFNKMMREAYEDGAEYMVRINDDSQFTSLNWVSKAVKTLASYDPPNVGMVGPDCKEGNIGIMTHDMVHRTHLKIFSHYYPDVFSSWYIDDWITHVYGMKRSTKIMSWVVKHHTEAHGTRYRADMTQHTLLQDELAKGRRVIEKWLNGKTKKKPEKQKEFDVRSLPVCKTLKKLLSLIDEVATKNDLWYSVAFGTLLAITRNGDCIVDIDMDIVIRKEDINKWKQNLPSQALLSYGKQKAPVLMDGSPNLDPWYKGQGSGNHLPIRLMALDSSGNVCSQPHVDLYITGSYPDVHEGSRKRCKFGSVETWCFTDAIDRLEMIFYKNWKKSKPRPYDLNAIKKHSDHFKRCSIVPKVKEKKTSKVIAYSLYGSDPRYVDGALANAKLIKTIYPTWKMRVYFDNTVPESILNKLRKDDVELIDMSGSNLNKMSWRFLAVTNAEYACMRDIDSRLSRREALAVKEWIGSNKKFHVMRDHPSHSNYAMSGGMWCSTEFPSMESLLKDVTNQAYLEDMTFLNNIMWPTVKKSVLQHDSFSCDKFGAKPFPTTRVGWEHIGSVFINGKMREGDVTILKNTKQPCVNKKCTPVPKVSYRSQSNEEKAIIEKFYGGKPKCGGTIVEIGALDGISYSNSWYFEHALQWKAVHIEANPVNFEKLKKNRPKAINVHSAMCNGKSIDFVGNFATGGINKTMSDKHRKGWVPSNSKPVSVPCQKFKDVFKAHGIDHVDVFILDVEGGEFEVLKTMDWAVKVNLWVVELDGSDPEKDESVRRELLKHGYAPATWNIRDWCSPGGDCTSNEVFVAVKKVKNNDFITNKKYISMCDVGYKTRSKNDFKLPIKPHSVICAQGSKQTLTEFFQLDIQAPFTLVTIEMDDTIPQETAWLDHKHLKQWYSWNSNHADVIPIPIGLNEDSQLEPMMKANVQDVKIDKILVNFKQDRKERQNLFHQVKDLPYVHVETYTKKWENTQELTAHYESISKYKWTLCPRGAGQDTHRLWEALYLGSIPIVLKSSISSLYEGLPVIQLNNWDELSLPLLEKRSKELPLTRTNAYFTYWQEKIRSRHETGKDTSMCANFEKIEKHMANIDLKKGVKDSTEEKLLVRISPFLDTTNSISVDIGGNQGLFSKLLQKIFKKEPKYIFDVIPRFVTKLKDMFPSSNVEQLAMSDVPGKSVDILGAAAWETEFNTGASILNRGKAYGHVLTSIQTTTLDKFFLEKEKIYFLKIDTEGMDGRVLHGATQMLKEKRIQSIFWENNKMQNSIGDSLYKNVQHLNSLGYASFQVGHDILFPISACRDNHRVFRQDAPTGNILSIVKNAPLYNFLSSNKQQPSPKKNPNIKEKKTVKINDLHIEFDDKMCKETNGQVVCTVSQYTIFKVRMFREVETTFFAKIFNQDIDIPLISTDVLHSTVFETLCVDSGKYKMSIEYTVSGNNFKPVNLQIVINVVGKDNGYNAHRTEKLPLCNSIRPLAKDFIKKGGTFLTTNPFLGRWVRKELIPEEARLNLLEKEWVPYGCRLKLFGGENLQELQQKYNILYGGESRARTQFYNLAHLLNKNVKLEKAHKNLESDNLFYVYLGGKGNHVTQMKTWFNENSIERNKNTIIVLTVGFTTLAYHNKEKITEVYPIFELIDNECQNCIKIFKTNESPQKGNQNLKGTTLTRAIYANRHVLEYVRKNHPSWYVVDSFQTTLGQSDLMSDAMHYYSSNDKYLGNGLSQLNTQLVLNSIDLHTRSAKQPYPVTKIEWGTCKTPISDKTLRNAANKKWRIVISSDLNPNYLSFLPSAVSHWKKRGLEVSVALVVKSGDTTVNSVVKVIKTAVDVDIRVLTLATDNNVPTGHAAKIARGFLATQFDTDVVTIIDIDYYLLWFDQWAAHMSCTPEDGLLALGYNVYHGSKDEGKYPMYLGTARSTTFAKFLNPTHEKDFDKWIKQFKNIRVYDVHESPFGVYGTFSDESLFRALLSRINPPVVWVNRPNTWKRINRQHTWDVTNEEISKSSDVFPNRPLSNCNTYFTRAVPVYKYLGILNISRDADFIEKFIKMELKNRDWAQKKFTPIQSLYECAQLKL